VVRSSSKAPNRTRPEGMVGIGNRRWTQSKELYHRSKGEDYHHYVS
jgi:hypothetical protein